MRFRKTESKIIYIRFRKDLDEIISKEALSRNMPKATLVAGVMEEYMRGLSDRCKSRFGWVAEEHLQFSPLSSSFFIKKGRSDERSIGKPMRVTLSKMDVSNMQLAAMRVGFDISHFRTAIMVTWLANEKRI